MLNSMRTVAISLTAILVLQVYVTVVMAENDYSDARAEMASEVEAMARETGIYTGRSVLDSAVMQAMKSVPRHRFVPDTLQDVAYLNRALPIGHDQTISQPFIVALMTDLAAVEAGDKVLEVGTGSGYQAAILAEMGVEVYSIEIVPELSREAGEIIEKLGYQNIHLRIGDGYKGWPDEAPFDAVIVTAAPETIPQTLVDQLAAGGKMVVPVGPVSSPQTLTVITKQPDGSTTSREIIPVGFVPMIHSN